MNTLVWFDSMPPRRPEVVRFQRVRSRYSKEGIGGMRLGGRVTAVVTAAIAVAAASACTGSPDPTTSPTSSVTPTSPSPSSSPTSETEAAAANAEALVREYYSVLDEFGADPASDPMQLEAVAVGKDLDVRTNQFARWDRDGWTQTGSTKLPVIEAPSVNLDNSDPGAGRVPTVQVDVCFDVSEVDVVDGSGASVVTAERPDTGWIRHIVSNYSWDSDPAGGWRVSTSVDLDKPPCDATD